MVPEQRIQNQLLTCGASEFIHCIKVIRLLHRMCVQSVVVLRSKASTSAEYRFGQGSSTSTPLLVRLRRHKPTAGSRLRLVRLEARRSFPGPLPLGFRGTLPRTHTESRSCYKIRTIPGKMTSVIRSYLSAMSRWRVPQLKLAGIRCLVIRSSRSRARS